MEAAKQKKHRQDIRIEELVIWTYEKQKADIIEDRGVGLMPHEKDADGIFYRMISGDGTYQIHRNWELGIKLEITGWPTAQIHPDAELIHDLIKSKKFTHLERGLLIDFGKTGLMPDWMPGAKPQIRPALNRKGKPKMLYAYGSRKKPIACILEIINPQEHINFKRKIYNDWWAALDKLKAELWAGDDMVTSFNVLPSLAKKSPWL